MLWGLLFPAWCFRLGTSGATSIAEIFFPILNNHTVGVGSACSVSLPLLPVLLWLLLYILSDKISVQLVFSWFLMITVPWFSCNFDVAVGGGQDSVYLLCHLDQESAVYISVY